MTEKDSYSVPYIDEIFDSLGGAFKMFLMEQITITKKTKKQQKQHSNLK